MDAKPNNKPTDDGLDVSEPAVYAKHDERSAIPESDDPAYATEPADPPEHDDSNANQPCAQAADDGLHDERPAVHATMDVKLDISAKLDVSIHHSELDYGTGHGCWDDGRLDDELGCESRQFSSGRD